MKMKKVEDLNEGELILADLYSRRNYMNGKYRAGQLFGLSDVSKLIKEKDIFFLETLQVIPLRFQDGTNPRPVG